VQLGLKERVFAMDGKTHMLGLHTTATFSMIKFLTIPMFTLVAKFTTMCTSAVA
jgi:hypothetical protein